MNHVVPDYYADFHCIANHCRHNCCIGWEIDIDDETYAFYNQLSGPFGQRLRAGIRHETTPCFHLDERERCVFLNDCGLCDIITQLGEDALCDICTDHPRFRNYFSDRVEIGLGLCCEEACRIILSKQEPTTLQESNPRTETITPEEAAFLFLRTHVIQLLQDRTRPFSERMAQIASEYPLPLTIGSPADWSRYYRNLERMDPMWDHYLDQLAQADAFACPKDMDTVWEQLAFYLIYRHLATALEDGRLIPRLTFCLHAVLLIQTLWTQCATDFAGLCEIARLYSCEIEYSDENVDRLLDRWDKSA